jgi:hypothetical protein
MRIAAIAIASSLLLTAPAAQQPPALERHELILHDFRTESGTVTSAMIIVTKER